MDEFRALGAEVYGISSDSVEAHAAWKQKENIAFPLLSDPDQDARSSYAIDGFFGLPGRATFVITPDGTVRDVYAANLDFSGHAKRALEVVRELQGKSATPAGGESSENGATSRPTAQPTEPQTSRPSSQPTSTPSSDDASTRPTSRPTSEPTNRGG
jgi:alkyl hydroperoxide reductase subunit AhpC